MRAGDRRIPSTRHPWPACFSLSRATGRQSKAHGAPLRKTRRGLSLVGPTVTLVGRWRARYRPDNNVPASQNCLMKFAICNETFLDWPFDKAFSFAHKCGYTGIEIAPFTIATDAKEISPSRRAEVRRQAEAADLEVVGLHWLLAKASGYYLTSPTARARANRTIRPRAGHLCRDLGAQSWFSVRRSSGTCCPAYRTSKASNSPPRFSSRHTNARRDRRDPGRRTAGTRRRRLSAHGRRRREAGRNGRLVPLPSAPGLQGNVLASRRRSPRSFAGRRASWPTFTPTTPTAWGRASATSTSCRSSKLSA